VHSPHFGPSGLRAQPCLTRIMHCNMLGVPDFASTGRTDPFEVVITDLGMAHIDGHRVAASIKTVSSATPVFLLTGWGKRTPAGAAIPNIDHVLSKPPRIADIRAALAGVCAQSQY
jgi:ActR/RegA family two-component response regulator